MRRGLFSGSLRICQYAADEGLEGGGRVISSVRMLSNSSSAVASAMI